MSEGVEFYETSSPSAVANSGYVKYGTYAARWLELPAI